MTEPARILYDRDLPELKPSEKRLVAAVLAVRNLAEKQRLPLRQMFLTAREMGLLEASDDELDELIAFAGDLPKRAGA